MLDNKSVCQGLSYVYHYEENASQYALWCPQVRANSDRDHPFQYLYDMLAPHFSGKLKIYVDARGGADSNALWIVTQHRAGLVSDVTCLL